MSTRWRSSVRGHSASCGLVLLCGFRRVNVRIVDAHSDFIIYIYIYIYIIYGTILDYKKGGTR